MVRREYSFRVLQIRAGVDFINEKMGRTFGAATPDGDGQELLLLSVRSGAAVSMPGMMDTVLNLGLNDELAELSAPKATTTPARRRWVMDNYRRLIQMFADVVRGADIAVFEEALTALKTAKHAGSDTELSADDLEELVESYKGLFAAHCGGPFPQDPWEQLVEAISAVYGSWNNSRAVKYRKINGIEGLLGTAVNVMAMVYGNKDEDSGTGVVFSRSPSSGEDVLFGEYLLLAQGEDVVSGTRTPSPVTDLSGYSAKLYAELLDMVKRLERHFKDVQDCEFTIESGTLYMLQTRNGKRTGTAAVKIAVDLVTEGLVTRADAVKRLVTPQHLEQLLHPRLADAKAAAANLVAKGIAASPGVGVGQAVFTAAEAEALSAEGTKVVLIRAETSPEDVGGMHVAEGIVTARGGMTSHAAVVARSWGKPCVAGAGSLIIDAGAGTATVQPSAGTEAGPGSARASPSVTIRRGDWVTLDGSSGSVFAGRQPLVMASAEGGDLATFLSWVHELRRLKIKANADTGVDCAKAVEFGCDGIGLVRTEHMFFNENITAMRRMILARSADERASALKEIEPLQTADFEAIFHAAAAAGPITIRLLDPPLHEFLPHTREQQHALSRASGIGVDRIQAAVEKLREANPMMGHRGCRLGITRPEITGMQARAIFTAAKRVAAADGITVCAEVMVPLVGMEAELQHQARIIHEAAAQVFGGGDGDAGAEAEEEVAGARAKVAAKACGVEYRVGTMIEVPRACFVADRLAQTAEFFSVGSNDLTQMAFGFSRDDAGPFIRDYADIGIMKTNPFITIDADGVGSLIQMALDKGRAVRPDLTFGVCGEHGGDPASIALFEKQGLDYVSCSPFRVPIAALAAAQARL